MKEILNSIGMKCNDVWPPAVNSETFNPKHGSRAMRELVIFFSSFSFSFSFSFSDIHNSKKKS